MHSRIPVFPTFDMNKELINESKDNLNNRFDGNYYVIMQRKTRRETLIYTFWTI